MDQNEQPRKAGSSSRDPPNKSQSHGDRPSERTQTHGRGTEQQHQLYRGHTEGYHFRQRGAGERAYHDEQVSRDARQSGRQRQDGSRRPGSTRQMQQPTRQACPARSQQPRQRAPETPSSMTNGQKSAAATSNEDWHMLDPNLSVISSLPILTSCTNTPTVLHKPPLLLLPRNLARRAKRHIPRPNLRIHCHSLLRQRTLALRHRKSRPEHRHRLRN
jgi:hypothetical protein